MNGTKYEVPNCETFSIPHSPSWAEVLASGSCFQIALAYFPVLMREAMFHNYNFTSIYVQSNNVCTYVCA